MDELYTPGADTSAQTRNRRVTKVCSRCRKKKIKCDFKFPTCTPCESASVTLCEGYDSMFDKDVPRSVVSYLETRIAQLELEVQAERMRLSEKSSMAATAANPASVHNASSALAMSLLSLVEPPYPDGHRHIVYAACQLPSSLPLPFARQQHPTAPGKGRRRPTTETEVSDIPRLAADYMLQNYVNVHLPQYPCVSEVDLVESYRKCIEDPAEVSAFEKFVVTIALAISANTLTWKNKFSAPTASEALWARARSLLEEMGTDDNGLRSLQVILLIAHYGFTSPNSVDVFYCVGQALRDCVQFRLHNDPPDTMPLNTLELDTRRRLFWTAWGMERAVCSYLRLPLSLNEQTVTTQFPSDLADSCITPHSLIEGTHKKASAIHMWKFRLMETEVHRVLFLEEKSPDAGLDAWLADMTHRLNDWYRRALDFAPQQRLEFRNVQLYFLKMRLHRPTPQNPNPAVLSRIEMVNAVMRLADDYRKQQQRSRLFYPWHAVHILFEAAVVLLETCWACSDWLEEHYDLQILVSYLERFPDILGSITRTWPDVQRCVSSLQTLMVPVVERLRAISENEPVAARDEETGRYINEYVFPDMDACHALKNYFTIEADQDVEMWTSLTEDAEELPIDWDIDLDSLETGNLAWFFDVDSTSNVGIVP